MMLDACKSKPSDALVASCSEEANLEANKVSGLLLRLNVLNGGVMQLRDQKAAAFLRRATLTDEDIPFEEVLLNAQIMTLENKVPAGKDATMLAEAFGWQPEPAVVFQLYDSRESNPHNFE